MISNLIPNESAHITLEGLHGERVTLKLDPKQVAMYHDRLTRSFYKRCRIEKILNEIDDAGFTWRLEEIAKEYDLCDCCDFSDINLYGAKRVLKVVTDVLYKYPRLRSRLCFVGSHHGLDRRLTQVEKGDTEVLKEFSLQYVCSADGARKVGALVHRMVTETIEDHKSYVATATNAFGLFDSVLLDKNDYEGYEYLRIVSDIRENESSGFHPKGCSTPESIVYHELGHQLSTMCGLESNPGFVSYYKGLTQSEIEKGLSSYALVSPSEFVAEAFAEVMCNPSPRPIAARTGLLIEKAYGNQ